MKASAGRQRRGGGSKLALVLICLGVLTGLPISAIRTAGQLQAGNDAAASNAKGLELYGSGKFEEAVTSFKQAIKLKPEYAEAYYNLGNTYFQVDQYKKAVEAYRQAVRYQPDLATAYNNMGTAYFRMGEDKKAIDAYQEAIRINPKEANYYYNLAATYLQRDNQKAALEQHKILQAIDAPLAEKLYNLIYKPMALVLDSAETRLSVSATDSQGSPVSDLTQEDFQVFEDGLPQAITSFSKSQVPLVYGLTIDTSGSVRNAFELVIAAGKNFIQTNLPDDETLLVRFISSDKIETVQEFTSDRSVLNKALDTLYIEAGQSAILDAVFLSAQRVAQYKFANSALRRAIILITDGDERASFYSMEGLLKLLRRIDVQVFVVSLNKGGKKGDKLNQNQPQRWIDLLSKLANETGGRAFFPKSVSELETATKQLTNLIRTEYVIRYKPANSVGTAYRRVSVSIVAKPGRENWSVLTRAGYLVSEK